jgi:hypothetical protein
MESTDTRPPAERYARIFRKAGAHLRAGRTEQARAALREGIELASAHGDSAMADRFRADLAHTGEP